MRQAVSSQTKVRTVYADLLGRVGFRVRQLIEHPPEGYRFLTRVRWPDRIADKAIRVDPIWRFRHALNRWVPLNLLTAYGPLRFKKPPRGTDLTYSESPLIFRREPWMVGVEVATQFAGYDQRHLQRYRRIVQQALASSHCRAVICWSEAARQSVVRTLGGDGFAHKLHVVHPAGHAKTVAPRRPASGRPVQILFVSSLVTPGGFQIKGGLDALEAFRALRQRFPDLELVIRCDLSPELRQRFEGVPGVRLLEGLIPREQLDRLYQEADIFWFPAHTLMSVVMLEAMSYGMPVIATDYFDNPEFVEDGRTGLLIPPRRDVPAWDTSPRQVQRALRRPDPDFLRSLVEKTALLVENPELRQRLGQAAREEVERGKFSLERKNRLLKTIFDQVLGQP